MNSAITHPLNLLLIVIGSFLSLTLGFFLLFNKKNRANIYLGILLLVVMLAFMIGFIDRFGLLVHLPHIVGTGTVSSFLFGPLSYLYVRSCTEKEFQLKPLEWLHFLPFVLDVLFFMPFLLKSGTEKIDAFDNWQKTGDFVRNNYLHFLKTLHCLIYIVFSGRLILRYVKHLTNTSSKIDYIFNRWMWLFLFLMVLPSLSHVIYFIFQFKHIVITLSLLSFIIFTLAIYCMTLAKPEIFHTFPHQMTVEDVERTVQGKRQTAATLIPSQREESFSKLVTFVEKEKPFYAPELTISELANQVKMPINLLSQTINEHLNVHFLDFINGYRVEDVKGKLADPQLSHYTILAIAFESGFNAKSTFYTVFKKHTGVTPSEYRKQVLAE